MCYDLVAFAYLIFLLFNFPSVLQTVFSESIIYLSYAFEGVYVLCLWFIALRSCGLCSLFLKNVSLLPSYVLDFLKNVFKAHF